MRPGDMVVSTINGHVWGEGLDVPVDELAAGEVVTVIDEDLYGWTYVVTGRGKKGYVYKSYLKLVV